jgi:hypothetical protein
MLEATSSCHANTAKSAASLANFLGALLILVAVITVVSLFGDISDAGDELAGFDWWLCLLILLLTTWSYA